MGRASARKKKNRDGGTRPIRYRELRKLAVPPEEPDFICTSCDEPVAEKDVAFANGEAYCLGCVEGISVPA